MSARVEIPNVLTLARAKFSTTCFKLARHVKIDEHIVVQTGGSGFCHASDDISELNIHGNESKLYIIHIDLP